MRRAIALSIDQKPFNDILFQGHALSGAAMLPPPAGVWGIGAEELKDLPGYGTDVEAAREKVRALMRELARMSYLWRVPHALDGTALQAASGPLQATPLDAALRATLQALGHGHAGAAPTSAAEPGPAVRCS